MTISSPTFQRLQDGIKSVDDLRVRGPINAALAWLSGDLVTQLNTHFGAVSQSTSVQIATHNADAAAHPAFSTLGKHKLWIPVDEMTLHGTLPPAAATVVTGATYYKVLDFDQSTIEIAFFNISMPSSWNEGTVTFVPVWTAAAGTGDVIWRLNGAAASNDDAIPNAFTAAVNSTDTLIATGDLHRGPESSALTIDGTPAANDTVFFRILRNASDGSDTLNADARLIGIELFYTTNAGVDVA